MLAYLIIGVTAYISYQAFEHPQLKVKYIFNAYKVVEMKEWYRLITHGFLHANWEHLIVNMLTLLFFGPVVQEILGPIYFLILYFAGLVVSSLFDLSKHKEHIGYNALGASGAISAVLFTYIFFNPWGMINMYFFIPIPGIIFGVLYLVYSNYMGKRGMDNIGHDAHFLGAVFGFIFPIMVDYENFWFFINQITNLY